MRRTAILSTALILVCATAAADDDDDDDNVGQTGPIEVSVNCNGGETITEALAAGDPDFPLTITIVGTCVENVTITRDDVTLRGIDPSRSRIVGAPDPGPIETPITVLGAERTVVENLTITGGELAGIAVATAFFTVRDSVIEDNVRFGIVSGSGAFSRVDNCVIRNNGEDGVVAFGGGFARVYNSTIRENGEHGIGVRENGSAQIGVAPGNVVGPNIIESNGRHGIQLNRSSSARIESNKIAINGLDGIAVIGGSSVAVRDNVIESNERRGIQISNGSTADVESTTIASSGRDGIGIFNGSSINLTDSVLTSNGRNGMNLFGSSSADVSNSEIEFNARSGLGISGGSSANLQGNLIASNNGSAGSFAGGIGIFTGDVQLAGGNEIRENTGGGILVIQGSLTMDDQGATDVIELNSDYGLRGEGFASLVVLQGSIRNNVTDGIQVVGQSYLVIRNTAVQDNGESGIRIRRDSGVRFLDPPTVVSGHTFFDLECLDLESSVEGVLDEIVVIDPACTGF